MEKVRRALLEYGETVLAGAESLNSYTGKYYFHDQLGESGNLFVHKSYTGQY